MEGQTHDLYHGGTAQNADLQLEKIKVEVRAGKAPDFMIHEDGTIRFQNRVCVPNVEELKNKILDEGHNTPYSIHPLETNCIRT